MTRTIAAMLVIAATWVGTPASVWAQNPESPPPQERRVAAPRQSDARGRPAERGAPSEPRARSRESRPPSQPPRAQASARRRDAGPPNEATREARVRARDVPVAAAPASRSSSLDDPRAPQQRSGAVRRPPSSGGGSGSAPRGGGVSSGPGGGAQPQSRGVAVARRGPPPPGYPGSAYRPPRRWYPPARWHYRPYRYDPYGWRAFGWSPLYYVPWSLVWGVNTPFFYGSVGVGYGYPFYWGAPYSGYPYYGPGYGYGHGGPYTFDTGGVRLRIRPRDAQVWVDGYYAGIVDDFDGTFQSLRLAQGGHKIEIRLPGYETLEFDVHVQPERTITFTEELRPSP